jgi:CheY-like chemotaxis protein
MTRETDGLHGLRILVVEDVFLLADELSELLERFGCEVIGPAGQLEDGLRRATAESLDGALLDVNLSNTKTSFPIARELAGRGIPFIFLSGYDLDPTFPPEFRAAPRLAKPVDERGLAQAMAEAFLAE